MSGLSILSDTVIETVDIEHMGPVTVTGSSEEGSSPALKWQAKINRRVRFGFSHETPRERWLVEANYSSGAKCDPQIRNMMWAAAGATVEEFRIQENGVFIEGKDGRFVEIGFDDPASEAEVEVSIWFDNETDQPDTHFVLPRDLPKLGMQREEL